MQKTWKTASLVLAAALMVPLAAFADPSASLKAPRAVEWKNFLGVNSQLLWFDAATYQAQTQKLKELGLEWTRFGLHWDRLEPAPGQFEVAELNQLHTYLTGQGIKSVVYLTGSAKFASTAPQGATNTDQYPPQSYDDFAARLGTLAQNYPGFTAWQAWNEANIPTYWQPQEDPIGYGNLLTKSMTAVKAAAPAATPVMGAMAYYSQMPHFGDDLMFQSLINQGQLNPDVVAAYHPYTNNPEGDDVAARDFVVHGSQLNSLLRSKGVKKIWATEFGWSSYAGPVEMQPIIGEAGQADYTLRRLALMSAMDYDRIFLFTLSDLDARATVRDQKYGLLTTTGQEKPVYKALKRFLTVTGPKLTPIDAPYFANAPADMINIAWSRPDGKRVWMFWAANEGAVTLPLPGTGVLHDLLTGASSTITNGPTGFYIPVKKTLQVFVF